MKKGIISAVVGLGFIVSQVAHAGYLEKSAERQLVKVCEAIQSNKKVRLVRAVKDVGMSIKAINDGLVCNGYDPVTFAILNGADTNAKYIARHAKVDYDALLAKL